ncbi:MAG: hypothetical protein PVH21_05265 [Myxococcales bacterium]
MRYVLLLLLLVIMGLRSDLGSRGPIHGSELPPVIFAAAFGSH